MMVVVVRCGDGEVGGEVCVWGGGVTVMVMLMVVEEVVEVLMMKMMIRQLLDIRTPLSSSLHMVVELYLQTACS